MDRVLYVAMNGANSSMSRQAATTNNMANANTVGFKGALQSFRALPVYGGGGMPTRTYTVESTVGIDFSPGVIQTTGRDMDVAVMGKGFLAVETPQGEAYTRYGSFEVDANGTLMTSAGRVVQGDGGPITIPANAQVLIAVDGTISTVQNGVTTPVGQLKLVNPPEREMVRGDDTLFRLSSGQPAEVDPTVRIAVGALEGSNVNMAEQLVNMITHQRMYDFQTRLMQRADENAQAASSMLNLNG